MSLSVQSSHKLPSPPMVRSTLGWKFSPTDRVRYLASCRAALEFMNRFGASGIKQVEEVKDQPEENRLVDSAEASVYLNVSPSLLVKGVNLGIVRRVKIEKVRGYFYHTEDLDKFRPIAHQLKHRKLAIK